jgi:hypothetical protein
MAASASKPVGSFLPTCPQLLDLHANLPTITLATGVAHDGRLYDFSVIFVSAFTEAATEIATSVSIVFNFIYIKKVLIAHDLP